ncbi:hypothetical protein SmJEL517_g00653 [Synchytrium microbalum]|uniref:Guanylate cyclase n=1 Tax=Synchytrium microbalum TaxID=1806994 RepID=A0A507CD99_9FUNG|nr:uncharacterized protein SmJEL517_g00653 [Synchytrium microbalum]TPX37592.1 hypothetical protein SmJEL517_g00653 [Synchytrium microbalum]
MSEHTLEPMAGHAGLAINTGGGCPFKPATSTLHNPTLNSPTTAVEGSEMTLKVNDVSSGLSGSFTSEDFGKERNVSSYDESALKVSEVGLTQSRRPSGNPKGDGVNSFTDYQSTVNKSLYDNLRHDCTRIEENVRDAEREVDRKEEEAFIMHASEVELQRLTSQQQSERKKKREAFEKAVSARTERKKAKTMMKKLMRDTKFRDNKILQQDLAGKATAELREALNYRREAFEMISTSMEARHQKQLKQLSAAQERRIASEKLLTELETRHLSDEARAASAKKFQVFTNHRKALDKRLADHLRDIQRLELKHAKERFECEYQSFEEGASLRMSNTQQAEDLEHTQAQEIYNEKDRLLALRETAKLMQLEAEHNGELRRLQMQQKQIVKQVKEAQKARLAANRGEEVSASRSARFRSLGDSRSTSTGSIESHESRRSSHLNTNNGTGSANTTNAISAAVFGAGFTNGDNLLDTQDGIQEQVARLEENLQTLKLRHKEALIELAAQHKASLETAEKGNIERLRELEQNQDLEMTTTRDVQENEISELVTLQEKEIKMEQNVHEAEFRMLLERKMLNAVLDTCIDGIINIDPIGTILRFNRAAEKQFGYTAKEIIGRNIRDLMPPEFSVNHDQYLLNYLTTGIKKVIGNGRRVHGLRKDGGRFPVHLSISEVKEEGAHIFTGIVRDMTAEVESERQLAEGERKKQEELLTLINQLDAQKARSASLISQMLPATISEALMNGSPVAPEQYQRATVFFSDIVGFTTLAGQVSPLEIVISQYDAYKVETIGDSYMVVSGVPVRNGMKHAGEIATMALHLLSVVDKFVIPSKPDYKLAVRIGINSGPVVAGVVGAKMPRYCLFGDTVNVASRMESTGASMKIQISETTYEKLVTIGGYKTSFRGETQVKGKGLLKTYWLTGKDDFPYELPPQ